MTVVHVQWPGRTCITVMVHVRVFVCALPLADMKCM